MTNEKRIVRGMGEVHEITHPGIAEFTEKLGYGQSMHELVDPENILNDVSIRIQNGSYPIFYSNHTQHLNIAGIREVIRNLDVRPADIHVAVAHSLVSEGQDVKIVEFAKNLAPVLESEHIHMVPVAREKDIKELQEESEEKAIVAGRDTFHNLRHLAHTFKEDAGFVFFPEATTEGAVKYNGKRNGMVEVTDNLFEWIISNGQKYKRDLIFVPIGMVGVNRILEPRTSNAHLRPKLEILKDKVSYYLGLPLGEIGKLAKIVIGKTFEIDDIWQNGIGRIDGEKFIFKTDEEKKDLNTFMMERVAQLLPEGARGYYGSK